MCIFAEQYHLKRSEQNAITRCDACRRQCPRIAQTVNLYQDHKFKTETNLRRRPSKARCKFYYRTTCH